MNLSWVVGRSRRYCPQLEGTLTLPKKLRLEIPLGEMDAVYCLNQCTNWSCHSAERLGH